MGELKEAMVPGARLTGIWLSLCSPAAVEIAAGAGADWLLIDMEHAPNELSLIADQLRAAKGAGPRGTPAIIRPPSADRVMTKRLLDVGAQAIMFPMIETAEAAAEAVSWTRYPPEGVRGISATVRANDYGRRGDYLDRVHDELCVIVQVETPAAVSRIAEIAAVPGVDAIFIGPGDLAASMGFAGRAGAPEVQAKIDEALAAIHAAGKAAGILAYGAEPAAAHFARGFEFVAAVGDTWLLARQLDALVAGLKG